MIVRYKCWVHYKGRKPFWTDFTFNMLDVKRFFRHGSRIVLHFDDQRVMIKADYDAFEKEWINAGVLASEPERFISYN